MSESRILMSRKHDQEDRLMEMYAGQLFASMANKKVQLAVSLARELAAAVMKEHADREQAVLDRIKGCQQKLTATLCGNKRLAEIHAERCEIANKQDGLKSGSTAVLELSEKNEKLIDEWNRLTTKICTDISSEWDIPESVLNADPRFDAEHMVVPDLSSAEEE